MAGATRATGETRRKFFRFAVVGATGFVIDASVLTLLVNGFGYGHYFSRAISFSLAVTFTWLFNRRWVFDAGAPSGSEYSGYFVVQLIGAAINLGIYVLVIETVPPLAAVPVVPLACGASIALVTNFLLARRFVFKKLAGSEPA